MTRGFRHVQVPQFVPSFRFQLPLRRTQHADVPRRVRGGAPWGWPLSASQTARTVFPQSAFPKVSYEGARKELANSSVQARICSGPRLSVVGLRSSPFWTQIICRERFPGLARTSPAARACLQGRSRHQFRIDGTTGGLPRCGPKSFRLIVRRKGRALRPP